MEAKSVEGDEREGRHYTVYPVFVQRTNLNGPASAWTVERRYSEFELLNARLKGLYHWVSQIEFPGKMLKDLMQNKKLLVETRRKSLEKYLQVSFYSMFCMPLLNADQQTLLRNAEVCRTNEMKKFLCHEDILRKMHGPLEALGDGVHKKSFMKNIMQVVESPFDFMNRLKNANMNSTDMLPDTLGSDGTPELLLTTTLGRNKSPESRPERILVDPTLNSGLNSWSVYPGQSGALTGPGSIRDPGIPSVSATDAAIDLFIELFELKEKNNWLRRQATVILLQQLFGGTVERKVTENLAYLGELECTVNLLEWARDYFWPGKAPFHETVRPIRTPEQKKKSKADAQGKMVHLFPELLGGLVGRHNAKRGAERLCAVFQNRRLNQQLIYIVLDELMGTAFPELRRN